MLLRARTLFARALETPGGLKIQTIHAFCESVLHRFPREAGVPFDFTVLEDFQRDAMLLEAREKVLAAGVRGRSNATQVETLFGLLSDFQIETSIIEALGKQRTLRRVLAQIDAAKANLRRMVPAASRDDVLTAIAEGYPPTPPTTTRDPVSRWCRPMRMATISSTGWRGSIRSGRIPSCCSRRI